MSQCKDAKTPSGMAFQAKAFKNEGTTSIFLHGRNAHFTKLAMW